MLRERTGIDQAIWPLTAEMTDDGDVKVGGVRLNDAAQRYGTPVHLVDEADVRARCRAFTAAFGPDSEIVYAGKAFLCRAMARWIMAEGLSLDVCSAGELAVARAVKFPASRIIVHGNGKTPEDLTAALAYGVDRIVVDSLGEITRLAALTGGTLTSAAPTGERSQRIMVRVTPGVDGHTHPALTTGVEEQQFGFSLASGAAAEAVRRVLAQQGLSLAGLHCHIGSQINDPGAFATAARRMVDLLALVRDEHGLVLSQLDLGGGFAVPYRTGDSALDPADLAAVLPPVLRDACASHRLPVPRLSLEPGRSIVARAVVTLYRVIGLKHGATGRVFVTVNGGMSDNPRPGLYGARYSVKMVGRQPSAFAERPMTVVGRHCEAGDVLIPDAMLPADLRPGDLLAVPCTGAYHHSMASNYNMIRRPPVAALSDGGTRLLIRRETDQDLMRRDVSPAR